MSHAELLERYVELLENLVHLYNTKAPKEEIENTRQLQYEIKDELRNRREGFNPRG